MGEMSIKANLKLCIHAKTISYCDQHPFILEGTLRENIAFFERENEAKVIKHLVLVIDF